MQVLSGSLTCLSNSLHCHSSSLQTVVNDTFQQRTGAEHTTISTSESIINSKYHKQADLRDCIHNKVFGPC